MSNNLDPINWVSDDDLPATAPNMIVFGKPRCGKSGSSKTFVPPLPRGRR